MSKINLISDIRLERIKTKRWNFFATFYSIIFVVVMLIFVLLLQSYKFMQKYNIGKTDQTISQTSVELGKYKDIEEAVINIEQGMKAINEISKNEPKWSLFLPQLEKVTPNDISFKGFDQDKNSFKANAQGKSVTSIARLIKSLEDYKMGQEAGDKAGRNLFKNIVVTGYSKNAQTGFVDFDVAFDMEEGILW